MTTHAAQPTEEQIISPAQMIEAWDQFCYALPCDNKPSPAELFYAGYAAALALSHPSKEAEAPHVDAGEVIEAANHMSFFSENVDRWGALEWWSRLADAVLEQDKAAVAGNELGFETYKRIAASSAMRLVRDYRHEVDAALRPPPAPAKEEEL